MTHIPKKTLATGASAIALSCAVAVAPAAAQQSSATALPPVTIDQQKPKLKPVAKIRKPAPASAASSQPPKSAKAKPVTMQSAQQQPPHVVEAAPASIAEGRDPVVAASGLARPATTTTLSKREIRQTLINTSDTAGLLTQAPGVSIFQGGGVSGLPTVNGLADDRVKILLNGMAVTSSCANHMNPPLSYIDPSQVAKVEILAGVTPVSQGGDSIAGTVVVERAPPHFAHPGAGAHTAGSISTSYRSNGEVITTSGAAHAATETFSVDYNGAWVRADNYEDGRGREVLSTEYEAQNHAIQVAVKNGGDLFIVQGGLQFIPYQGFVNQRMDMVDNEAWFLNTRYVARFGWGRLDARAFYQHVDHMMDFLPDKKYNVVPMMMPNGRKMPMRTDAADAGYSLKAEIEASEADTIRIGSEFHHYAIDDWWPPVPGMMMMCCDTYQVLNGATRDRLGTFIEWERRWDRAWSTLLGVRNDMVWMDTGDVQGYNAGMVYGPDAAAFNARDHKRTDTNFDATALLRYQPSATSIVELGYAMKTRSPNVYERYAWSSPVGDMGMAIPQMAMNMIGWFGDGNGYTGNLDLKPEHAHTASITLGWRSADHRYAFKVTPYYTYVDDYIGVRKLGDSAGAAHAGFVNLQFANHDAELYGVNVSGAMPLGDTDYGTFALTGIAAYVHGENAETGVSLYHMMPWNTRLALTHRLGGWSSAVELDLVAGKHNVDTVRNEMETGAYALVNLRTSYEVDRWRFDLGVTNLFDTYYEHPLGGVYIEPTMGNRDPALGPREVGNVPSPGRSINVGATLKF